MFKHGFKAEAERLAEEIRSELGIRQIDPLDSNQLASNLLVPVVPADQLVRSGLPLKSLQTVIRQKCFSAATLVVGDKKMIVYNPAESPGRRANSLTHEISHIVLEHPLEVALLNGCRKWDPEKEAEADWLASTLLVPRDGALWWMRRSQDRLAGAKHFGVSLTLFNWRVNQTGILRQVTASKKYFGN